jgi:serine protease Do
MTALARLTMLLLLGWVSAAPAAPRVLPDFSRLVAQHGAAVVNIHAVRASRRADFSADTPESQEGPRGDFPQRYFQETPEPQDENSLGSGFIISPDGDIMTCAHVVDNAREILVRLNDRREFLARLVGMDRRSDVALLKIEASRLPTVVIGDPSRLRVGDWVLAIGSPFGFDSSATAGIVSAKGRTLPSENYVSFIQTDVPINPGNSGGPLFNLQGEVVGVNSQIYSGTGGFLGVSFAIPIDSAMKIAAQLKRDGRVRRGWLGVSLQEVSRQIAGAYGLDPPRGALVTDILPGSPASKSDLRPGDIVLTYEGKGVDHSADLAPLVGLTPPGTLAHVGVFRRDQGLQTVLVTVGELKERAAVRAPARQADAAGRGRFGMAVGELSEAQRKNIDVDHGVSVGGVDEGPARDAGLRSGDVILEIDGKRVNDTQDFFRLLEHAPPNRPVLLRIRRGMATMFLAFPVEP